MEAKTVWVLVSVAETLGQEAVLMGQLLEAKLRKKGAWVAVEREVTRYVVMEREAL